MYTKAGGQGSNICIYYSLPGQTLENGIQLLEGDKGITELLRDYKGLNVISLYIEENSGPIIAVDALGNVIENNVAIPQLMYDVEIEGVEVSETGAVDGGQTEGVGVSETGAVGVGVAETEGAVVSETEAAGVGETEGVGVSETEAAGFGETEGVGVSDGVVVSETDSDDSSEGDEEYVGDGQSGSSSDSDCPSWMLEDLEGPLDDDIFVSRDAEYGRKLMKTVKSWVREMRKKKRVEKQQTERDNLGEDGWFSDVGGEDDLHSLKGSDDENVDNVVWNDAMDRQDVDLCIVLQRMYVCFGGLKEGFLDGCRPFIGLDGCFLKGMHKGQLLSAIGRDGNDNIYPIAMAYVEIEKHDSWEWFLNLLLRDIGSHDERGWAFISDRQKGLIEAVTHWHSG
ncbi:hypothetical protein Sango_0492600 [Sesamum angolense]|uniref:MULE transposase domain-containing protein n=1 Tax=Sesamum angolense TaxID=2727404 RepID=A0AAE2C4U6_9LAMI|nr:hypothetical protein Sango_0492600 [Sesamum angolense]